MFFRKLILGIWDSVFAWFTPRWRREAHAELSSLTRYINYHRHETLRVTVPGTGADGEPKAQPLTFEDLRELQRGLRLALLACDREAAEGLEKKLRALSLPGAERNPLAEMVESIFVIMVVFLGIRTYYAQPFRIPTGSMQPSLNGIIIHPVDEVPSLPTRVWHTLTLGSSYVEAVAEVPKSIIRIEGRQKWLLFSVTDVTFSDGTTLEIPSAKGAVTAYFADRGKIAGVEADGTALGIPFERGETIIRARVDAGDMIIVNRVAYNFRLPRRGETFVFDTRNLNTEMKSPAALRMSDQRGGTHYIKRLCGLPGDTLYVQPPYLLINGKPAQEPTIRRVAEGKPPFNAVGYQKLSARLNPLAHLTDEQPLVLKKPINKPNLREYAALGDNTTNSLDSRYWGPVRQFNVVGPASFTLWPFSSHWGLIE